MFSGYGIGYDSRSLFLLANFDWGKNTIIFGEDNSSSMHKENDLKDILVLGESLTQGSDDTTITAEVNFPLIPLIKKGFA